MTAARQFKPLPIRSVDRDEPWEAGPPLGRFDDDEMPWTDEPTSAPRARGRAEDAPRPDPWASRLVTVDASWTSQEPPPRKYLMHDTRTGRGAIPATGAALLVAAGGAGKSFVSVSKAISVATGTPWLGVMQPTAKGRVLIVSAEEPADEIRRRVYAVAHEHGITTIPDGAIDVIDIHDVHMPLLTPDAQPTEHAFALTELVKARGPYALGIVDPLARISGASIDGDNVAACALITALEGLSSAGCGLVLGVHHTSQTARRAGITDATAIRGATGLGDSARLVLVLTVEEVDMQDTPQWADLGEIVTITRAKANHVGRWEPVQMRRGEHGVLLPLDGGAREIVARARQAADPSARRQAAREEQGRQRTSVVAAAVVELLAGEPAGMTYRGLRGALRARLGRCSDGALDAALAELGERIKTTDGPRGATVHTLADGGAS